MEERHVEIPDSFWERMKSRPWMLLGLAAAVALVLGVGGYALLQARVGDGSQAQMVELDDIIGSDGRSAEAGYGSSDDETRAVDATGSAGSPAAGEGGSDEPSPDASDGSSPDDAHRRAPMVAYRNDGTLWVAAEDGSGARAAATVDSGAFALSPDGTWLAYVDSGSETLHIVEMSRTEPVDRTIGPAKDLPLAWAPDSTALAYTAPGDVLAIRVVRADGTSDRELAPGHRPAFSPDGDRIALVANAVPGQTGSVVIVDLDGEGGGIGVRATEVVWGGDGLLVSVARDGGSAAILTTAVDGSGYRELVAGGSSDGRPVMYSGLCVSPDGASLMYATTGDDGHSAVSVLRTKDGHAVSMSVRRDTYPLCWSADGSRVFFVEGNAFQGEHTSLLSAASDGMGRSVVVDGGGR